MLQNSKVLSAINTKGPVLYQMRNHNSSILAEVRWNLLEQEYELDLTWVPAKA